MATVKSDVKERSAEKSLSESEVKLLDAYWRAANYLSVGQIYLLDNPLLKKPLKPEHIKPRLLGHWGTTPGLNATALRGLPARAAAAKLSKFGGDFERYIVLGQ